MSSTIAAGGMIKRDAAEPLRVERFVAESTPAQLAEQLTRLQAAVVEATEATRRNRGNQKIVFEDLACGTAGALVGPLRHGLGRRARWRVVDWTRTTAANFAAAETVTFAPVGATGDTLTRSLGSWLADGFRVGMVVQVLGTALNNVRGRIEALSATVMTFGATLLAAEGPTVALGVVSVTEEGGGPALQRAASTVAGAINDENTITLVSYVAGIASIEVE